ncbi:hypothetical protein B5X24_HaOG217184 [Helicoverpa armigera]|uniref:CHK kinase-like domain-containing protein n=1 Tax=Helicoverpa armigera TaxID=29058 RepID=A0A2W1C180_HELAM|nr:hypothetical protein B5X24_HaOG217184 [Helicoverpa armigera]
MEEKPHEDLPSELRQYMENIAKSEAFISYEIVGKKLPITGGGYMGILYEVNIQGKTNEDDKELNIFIKNIVENEQMKIYSVPKVFEREAIIYTDVFKIFDELQDKAKIPDDERLLMPKTYEGCNPKSIILEHLGKRGFKVYDRMETISFDYAKLCVTQLGKFHALSFVLQAERPEYFKENIATMKQPFKFEEVWHGFVKNMYNYSINCLEPDVRDKVGEIILEKVADYPKYMNDVSGVCTLCHGDFKHNNVMAKEIDAKVKEVIAIDFQIAHHGSPILDFLYFIFNGTDKDFRRKHLVYLKDLYYDSMKNYLEYFGMDIEKVFQRMEFERVFKEKMDFGLMINVFYVPFLFAADEDAPDVANESLSTLSFKVDDRFQERFRGVVDDFIEWGYI